MNQGTKELDAQNLAPQEDCVGNNIALTCPMCGKVFLVSKRMHGERHCPACGKKSRHHHRWPWERRQGSQLFELAPVGRARWLPWLGGCLLSTERPKLGQRFWNIIEW